MLHFGFTLNTVSHTDIYPVCSTTNQRYYYNGENKEKAKQTRETYRTAIQITITTPAFSKNKIKKNRKKEIKRKNNPTPTGIFRLPSFPSLQYV
jgi:hypothetical protein